MHRRYTRPSRRPSALSRTHYAGKQLFPAPRVRIVGKSIIASVEHTTDVTSILAHSVRRTVRPPCACPRRSPVGCDHQAIKSVKSAAYRIVSASGHSAVDDTTIDFVTRTFVGSDNLAHRRTTRAKFGNGSVLETDLQFNDLQTPPSLPVKLFAFDAALKAPSAVGASPATPAQSAPVDVPAVSQHSSHAAPN